jgi:hypothetical protein
MFTQYKYYLFALLLLASFVGGWQIRSWYDNSKELATQKQVKVLTDEFKKQESLVSSRLELKLQELKANERIIEREKLKVIDRPIYNNICIDADGMQLLNKQRGKQDTNTGKSSN